MKKSSGKKYIYKLAVTFILFFSVNGVFAQKTIENLKPDSLFIAPLTYDYIPDATYDQIKKRLVDINSTIPLNFNNTVKSFVDYFTVRNREYTKMVVSRSTYYFPMFEEIFAKHGLPDELKYLAIVESGLKPTAQSWAAAVGLWQFVYLTGQSYGLHVDWYIDERMDPVKSTEAAARYIKSLYNMFGDWELALAAYNCGPGNVRKAIRRSGYKRKFWQIYRYLPRETRGYVPQFVAITYALNYPEEHNFVLDEAEYKYPMATDTIMAKKFINHTTLGEMLDI
jgi:membrane-bound lytic murein transglycosylase D